MFQIKGGSKGKTSKGNALDLDSFLVEVKLLERILLDCPIKLKMSCNFVKKKKKNCMDQGEFHTVYNCIVVNKNVTLQSQSY